ncbi:hypothetical protein, partial [Nocardia neocaledoniensis]|uniref:hypothetical protein n=1 Tax=Nocardia neocaledoniensis TaxID=236511 RepID=UPI002456F915
PEQVQRRLREPLFDHGNDGGQIDFEHLAVAEVGVLAERGLGLAGWGFLGAGGGAGATPPPRASTR